MSTKRKAFRKTVPIFGAAAAAGLFSMMGTALAEDTSARRFNQIVLADEAEVAFIGWSDDYSNPVNDPSQWGKNYGRGRS